ncbi:transcriptional regulator, partial [Acinetobacter baumannii]
AYVARNLENDPAAVVRALHVLRSELDCVLHSDFRGLKVRFIGDCVHGVLAEGAKATDREATVSTAVLCAAAMRSSFDLAKEKVEG